jgi:hypothetical protein
MGWRDDMWGFDLARFTVAGWATFIMSIVAGVALGTAVGFSVHAVLPAGQGAQAPRIGKYAGIACAFGFFFAAKGMLKAMGVHIIRSTNAKP